MAKIMANHGIRMNEPAMTETPAQVSANIRELFPRIPEHDVEDIIARAWEAGTDRVGTNEELDLPRRVQLAVGARIRHKYTDYDVLLKALGYLEARRLVEADSLKKVREWRGENVEENDTEFEEVVRDIIVIDDDEDEDGNGSEADDEESTFELGDTSDDSVEFTHRLAADEDLGAESHDETSQHFVRQYMPSNQRVEQENNVGQRMGDLRQQMRNVPAAQFSFAPLQKRTGAALGGERNSTPVRVPGRETAVVPDTVMIDGRLFRRVSLIIHILSI